MKLVKPIPYSGSQLVSTTATESVATWLVGTTYAIGAKVQYIDKIYESLVGSNVGNQPNTSPTQWLDLGADNRRAMFDALVNSQTTATTSFTTVVKPLVAFNSLAYLNIVGATLDITIRDGLAGPITYTRSIPLDDTLIVDWYMYFFEPFDLKTDVILTDIPVYNTSHITTVITGVGTVAIGAMIYGTQYSLGNTQYGATIGIKDYSVKTTDAFGNTSFVQRAYSKRMDADVMLNNSNLNFVHRLLSDIRAIPVVWIGSDAEEFKPLVMFGYYRDFNISIPYPTYSMCNISIEGLI